MRRQTKAIFTILLMLSVCTELLPAASYDPQKASFSMKFKDEESPYKITPIILLPNEKVEFEVITSLSGQKYTMQTPEGQRHPLQMNKWQWLAPKQKGEYILQIMQSPHADTMNLHIFVMVPFHELKGEYLNGYKIGHYPQQALHGLSIYKPPPGFIEVTEANEQMQVSPHFRLKQFLCKQPGAYPKYIVLQERLVLKLEALLHYLNENGYSYSSLHIMSSYRTPSYNKALGNVAYSRHLYGAAADIFLDEHPQDGVMDDLNDDGKIDRNDAKVLYDLFKKLDSKLWYEKFLGGLGLYKENKFHGPYIHVDVRGKRACWGE